MRRSRATTFGYTLAEILIVVSIIGIVVAIALPRFADVRDKQQLASARVRLTRAVMAARQAAIQTGQRSYFKHNNSSISVNVADGTVITSPLSLTDLYGVEVVSPTGLTEIEYDPRGVSTQATKKVFKFQHIGSGHRDSVCVSRLGNTIRNECP